VQKVWKVWKVWIALQAMMIKAACGGNTYLPAHQPTSTPVH